MTTPNPVRVDQLLNLALQQPTQQREDFLRRMASHDAPLRDAVLAQLALVQAAESQRSAAGFFGGAPPRDDAPSTPVMSGMSVGQRIGDFTLVRFLGKGGMGQVWEARQESLRRQVALKLLLPGAVDPSSLEKFVREARAGGKASHKNLVATYGYGDSDGLAWIAQELVQGSSTLADAVDRFRDMDRLPDGYYPQVAKLIEKVARGMQAAHDAGIIHRDLKPANILVGTDDEPRVADFGLARVTGDSLELSATGSLAGTYYYMSPEQVTGKRTGLDARTDIFSLGIVLYEMLTLQRPFIGDSETQIAEQIDRWDPPVADKMRSHCPRDLAVIAEKAMQKAKAQRYPTMAAFAEDLRRFLADEPILAKPTSVWMRARKWMRRHPTIAATATLVTVGGVVSGWLALRNAALLRYFDSLAGVVQLEEAIAQSKELPPSWPQKIQSLENWRSRIAQPLLDKQESIRELAEMLSDTSRSAPQAGQYGTYLGLSRTLTQLESDLRTFAANEVAAIDQRIRWARLLQDQRLTEAHPEAQVTWQQAREQIRGNPRYAGLNLDLATVEMHDLVPIGENPQTGLFEFYHLPSAWDGIADPRQVDIPQHRPDGTIDVQIDTGIVFVLIPGGLATIGSQGDSAQSPRYDPDSPTTEQKTQVRLDPYLIARHEMTRGQWERLGGQTTFLAEEGDHYDDVPVDGRFPAESVRWDEAIIVLRRQGLALPTEAQWEHACRGGTDSIWWTGDQAKSLEGAANMYDLAAKGGGVKSHSADLEIDDGFIAISPVGTYRANSYGMHDMVGNVWELCADMHVEDSPNRRDGDGLADLGDYETHLRSARGGSCQEGPIYARSAHRFSFPKDIRDNDVGFRAARSLKP